MTFSGLGWMPHWETMYPSSMPRGTPKDAFLGVQLHPIGSQAIKCHVQVVIQVVRLPGFYDYIVYVSLDGSPDVVSENMLHTSLVCSARVSETKRHHYVAVHPEGHDE
jgi:hypothetical protein